MAFTGLADRLRALDGRRVDALLGLVAGIEMQIEALFIDAPTGDRLLAHFVALLLALCLIVRRTHPWPAFLVAQVSYVVVQGAGSDVADHLYLGLFAVLFLSYSIAANTSDRAFRAAPPIALAAAIVAARIDDYESGLLDDVFFASLVYVAAPMITGRLVRSRSRLQRALREKARRLERERESAAAQAVTDERSRIAGELHDIVAHALSEMTVQATAAGRLARRNPERSREAFAAVETSGRDALAELRRLLGVLRRDDEELALAPQPSLRHLAALAARTRAAGLPVELHTEGSAIELPAGLDVTGYRVVQEALGGARDERNAGHAVVRVRYGDRDVALEVRDDGADTEADEVPMLGLRERVGLYGGDFHSGPLAGGGHVVRARLPLGGAA